MNKAMMLMAVVLATSALAGDTKSEVRAQIDGWAAAFNAHDTKALLERYTDDAKYIFTFQGQEGAGKAALEANYTQSFKATPDIKVTLKEYDVVPVNDTIAVGMGTWEDTFTGPDGKKVTVMVQSSEVFVKVGGTWKVKVDHASFVPPPQPPPPAGK